MAKVVQTEIIFADLVVSKSGVTMTEVNCTTIRVLKYKFARAMKIT